MEYDDIIVGSGSSGAVLAARLSEDPGRHVLLLEAGPDYAEIGRLPPEVADGFHPSTGGPHDWGWEALFHEGKPSAPYPRGKVTGGSSAVNGCVALRGTPADYDEWAAWGNPEWAFAKVLPHFRRLEDDQDIHDDLHGSGGPIYIRRWKPEEFRPVARAVGNAARRLGFDEVADHNHPESTGVGPIPVNVRDGLRISTALGYLAPARHRLNLTLRPDCAVHRVLLEDGRAVGVEVECGGEVQRVRGRRTTLSAGALATPAILLRSGIGPRAHLEDMAIPVAVDLPGVGQNLADHPGAGVSFLLNPGAVSDEPTPFTQLVIRYTSPGSSEFNDMQIYAFNQVYGARGLNLAELAEAPRIGSIMAGVQRPKARGSVRLRSADPREQPLIELDFGREMEDIRRLVHGVRIAWSLINDPEVRPLIQGAPLFDGSWIDSDEQMEDYVRNTAGSLAHPVGTARMGPDGDPGAVVDQWCRVRGLEGLRVVDASVMPNIPRANTNLTCIMLGERVAEWMRGP